MFRKLALGGGGVRAGLHVGALKALEAQQGHLQFPGGLWGCSAGAVLATAVAFNLTASQIETMYRTYLKMDTILPAPRLQSLADLFTKKGMFTMDAYEQAILTAFDAQGIDLRDKCIADAPQPLHIVASNLTLQSPVVLTKQVRILDAIRCSSCLPFVFQPQVLYSNVYLDGGVFVDCLDSLVDHDCLVLHISQPAQSLYPSELESLSLNDYLYRVYRSIRTRTTASNVLWLQNGTIGLLTDITEEEKTQLITEGHTQALTFLTKRLAKERKDVSGSSLPAVVGEGRTGL
jgi:predicted patatin/cPLA2 family phospholipase